MNRVAVGSLLSLALTVPPLRAQLVNDGATATLANVTNAITGTVTVGTNGSFTLLTLADNALLTNSVHGVIGRNATASSNEVRLTSGTARWQVQLVIEDGGLVRSRTAVVGSSSAASDNEALVTGPASQWNVQTDVTMFVGLNSASANNRVAVNGGTLRVASPAGTSVLDVRRGTNVLNAGLVEADRLLLTNTAGLLDLLGGTLVTRGALVNNGSPMTMAAVAHVQPVARAAVVDPAPVTRARLLLLAGEDTPSRPLVASTRPPSLTVRRLTAPMAPTSTLPATIGSQAGRNRLWGTFSMLAATARPTA